MRDQDKNRDPERARKRARNDARCSLRKLDLLERLEAFWAGEPEEGDTAEGLVELLAIHLAAEVKA
jgi:hypothetical protein